MHVPGRVLGKGNIWAPLSDHDDLTGHQSLHERVSQSRGVIHNVRNSTVFKPTAQYRLASKSSVRFRLPRHAACHIDSGSWLRPRIGMPSRPTEEEGTSRAQHGD